MSKTWLITGASAGLGRLMTERLLTRGDRVVGTVRRDAMISAADSAKPALRLTLGSTAYNSISRALAQRLAAIEAQREVAFSADRNSDNARVSTSASAG